MEVFCNLFYYQLSNLFIIYSLPAKTLVEAIRLSDSNKTSKRTQRPALQYNFSSLFVYCSSSIHSWLPVKEDPQRVFEATVQVFLSPATFLYKVAVKRPCYLFGAQLQNILSHQVKASQIFIQDHNFKNITHPPIETIPNWLLCVGRVHELYICNLIDGFVI